MADNKKNDSNAERAVPARPVGFRGSKPSAANNANTSITAPKKKAAPRLFAKNVAQVKKRPAKAAPKARPNKPKKPVRIKEILLTIGIVAIIVVIIGGLIFLLNNNKTVHQMPTILRITEEPTQEPAEVTMLRESINIDSGDLPSFNGFA